jgi:hypothetical protein
VDCGLLRAGPQPMLARAGRIMAKGGRIMGSMARSLHAYEDKCRSDVRCGSTLGLKRWPLARGLRGSAGRTAASAGQTVGRAGRIMAQGGRIMGSVARSLQDFGDNCGSDAGHGSIGPESVVLSGMDCGCMNFAECRAIQNKPCFVINQN